MDFRILPKLLLWMMLMVSTLGAISSLMNPGTEQPTWIHQAILKQEMAVQTATNFAREWMEWNGEELPAERLNRLKLYVNPKVLSSVVSVKSEQKYSRQKVIAAEFVSLTTNDAQSYTVRVRVVVLAPERVVWTVDVPVWVHPKMKNGASVTGPPVIRLPQEPPVVPEGGASEANATSAVTLRMKPTIESFLRAFCESKDAESLSNYVSTGTTMLPLQGRIRMLNMDSIDVAGLGPFTAKVAFTVQDTATGFRFSQVWKLAVTEENQKFFVGSVK